MNLELGAQNVKKNSKFFKKSSEKSRLRTERVRATTTETDGATATATGTKNENRHYNVRHKYRPVGHAIC